MADMESEGEENSSICLDLNLNPLGRYHCGTPCPVAPPIDSIVASPAQTEDVEKRELVERLRRMSQENKKLTEMVTIMCGNYNLLHEHIMDMVMSNNNSKNGELSLQNQPRKRVKASDYCESGQSGNTESTSGDDDDSTIKKRSSNGKKKFTKIVVHIDSSDMSLVVRDGYQWRKYGQKVTRDNPSPRAYFKCSFAPSCSVKKKVQKSAENTSLLIATYEGEHNHERPSRAGGGGATANPLVAGMSSSCPSSVVGIPTAGERKVSWEETESGLRNLVEEMASSLTKNSNFTTGLAPFISDKSGGDVMHRIIHPKLKDYLKR